MSREAKLIPTAKAGRFHLGLSSLFWLQLLVTPVFLSPFYRSLGPLGGIHPYVALIALLVAPAIYVALILGLPLLRRTQGRRHSVTIHLGYGSLYGLLFCTLAFGPLAVLSAVELVTTRNPGRALELIIELIVVSAFLLLHYCIIGAVVGGGVGITADLFERYARPSVRGIE